jgi:hypothetical protein
MGAWCVDTERNIELLHKGVMLSGVSVPAGLLEQEAKQMLTYCSFLPSAVHRRGLLDTFVYTMAHRAEWANEYLASQEGMPDLFGPRDKTAYERQAETHASFLSRFLSNLLAKREKLN